MNLHDEYTENEWAEVLAATPLDHLPTHQIAPLHRHWLWAHYARERMLELLRTVGPPDPEHWEDEGNYTLFLWYGLLYSVIEGAQARRVRIAGWFRDDVRAVREPFRQARHAIFHVGTDEAYYDLRLAAPLQIVDSALVTTRVHRGFGRLSFEGLRARNIAAGVDSLRSIPGAFECLHGSAGAAPGVMVEVNDEVEERARTSGRRPLARRPRGEPSQPKRLHAPAG